MPIHHFDLMRMVVGREPQDVYCRAWQPPTSPYREHPAATVVAGFAGGVVLTFQGSWVSTGEPTAYAGLWHMECETGEIVWTGRTDRDLTTDGDRLWVRPLGEPLTEVALDHAAPFGRAVTLRDFTDTVRHGRQSAGASTGRDNLRSLELTFATIRSAQSGRVESVAGAEPIGHPLCD